MRSRPFFARGCLFLTAFSSVAAAACIPFAEAPKRIGETVCVTGKVVKVASSPRSGTHFLNFCEDYKGCPFAVVIFSRDLPEVGDVRWLEGKVIEIHGKVKDYKGQAEIVLSDARQLTGEAAKLPALPKRYDVQTKGNYSAGEFQPKDKPTKPKSKKKKGDNADRGEADPNPPPN
jgi:DNA/RNA endonuclease YhcR with UshA esterase domain